MRILFQRILFILAGIVISSLAYGQKNAKTTKGLDIGEMAPNFLMKNTENLPKDKLRLSDFRGKLVILDFWATSCGSCLSAMPKMDSLQQIFKDQIQIILVTEKQTSLKVKSFLSIFRNDEIKAAISRLPNIYDDARWDEFFPHQTVPHHVWINQEGKVVAITNGYNTNAENINEFLKGNRVEMQIKDDYLSSKFPELFLNNNLIKPVFGSAFYDHIPNFKSNIFHQDTSTNVFSRRITGVDLNQIARHFFFATSNYKQKLPKFLGYDLLIGGAQRIIYLGDVFTKLSPPKDMAFYNKWQSKNMFIYEAKVPLQSIERFPEMAKKDIINYALLKYKIGIKEEEIYTDCYVVKFNNIDKLKSRLEDNQKDIVTSSSILIKNMPFERIYHALSMVFSNGGQEFGHNGLLQDVADVSIQESRVASLTGLPSKPVIFETETQEGGFNFEISGDLKNYQHLINQLRAQGISIAIKKRKVKYLVFSDESRQ